MEGTFLCLLSLRGSLSGGRFSLFAAGRRVPTRGMPTAPGRPFRQRTLQSRGLMRTSFLPFARPALGEEEIAEVVDTLKSGWITTGPKVERFTEAFAEAVEGRFAVPVSSATAGLHVALLALGAGPGDEVITTPLTFVATLNTIVHCGAVPVLADIDAATLNVRLEEIEKRVTAKTKLIVPVHSVGQPAHPHPILD